MATPRRPTGKTLFLDTNGWLALLNAGDALHGVAHHLWQEAVRQDASFVLTDWVVAETGNGLARTAARTRFADALALLRASPRVEMVVVDSELLSRAIRLYADRPDKTWGLVDCASFVVMGDRNVREAFTNDRHFGQAGFTSLLPLP